MNGNSRSQDKEIERRGERRERGREERFGKSRKRIGWRRKKEQGKENKMGGKYLKKEKAACQSVISEFTNFIFILDLSLSCP